MPRSTLTERCQTTIPAECVWVMASVYDIPREKIAALEAFFAHPGVVCDLPKVPQSVGR